MAADFHIHVKRKKLNSFISKTTTANILLFFPFAEIESTFSYTENYFS